MIQLEIAVKSLGSEYETRRYELDHKQETRVSDGLESGWDTE